MPVFYKLYQENNPKSVNVGKWYAKAKCLGYWDLEKIADHIQDNVSAKKSDVIAVLKELVVVMGEAFSAGYGVKLDGFGSFKVGLKTKAAESAKEFTATKHIVGSRVNFQPETHWSAADGNRRQKQFLSGLKVEEYGQYDVDKSGSDEGELPLPLTPSPGSLSP